MGLATAERFLKEGVFVVIADLNQASGDKAMADIRASGLGAGARSTRVDVASEGRQPPG